MAQVLRHLGNLSATRHPDLLVGTGEADDAGVYRLSDELALVQTVDFFTPVVDEAHDWGRIAAANALSDVYAMGGTPLTALQLVAWPREELPFSLLSEVIEGGAAILSEAGCTIVGGHSVDDPEPKYGLAVTGLVHPERMVTKRGARPGDALVLTKPLGSGIVSTAIKAERADPRLRDRVVEVMASLNAGAARAMLESGVRAATDVTGYGLLGHLGELLARSGVAAEIRFGAVPVLEGVEALAAQNVYPGGSRRNLTWAAGFTDFGDLAEPARRVLADAQTSGGLLTAVSSDRLDDLVARLEAEGTPARAVIGEVIEGEAGHIRVLP